MRLGKDKKPKQHFIDDNIEYSVEQIRQQAENNQEDLYMAIATFGDRQRKQICVDAIQALYIDIDCGPSKDYADQKAGLLALQKFCTDARLPKPTYLINSGGGWHVYWILNAALTRDEWQPLADGLHAACHQFEFNVDHSCTKDAARILRVPGSLNWKYGTPRAVTIAPATHTIYSVTAFDHLRTASTGIITLPPKPTFSAIDLSLSASLAGFNDKPKSFRTIISRSQQRLGCDQIILSVANQASEAEPLWRAVLSIAQFCTDREKAIHGVSDKYPGYDAADTDAKASAIVGPYKCSSFNDLRPGVCVNCPNWGRITSPIQLGEEIRSEIKPEKVDREHPQSGMDALQYVLTNEPIPCDTAPTPFPYHISEDGNTYRLLTEEEAQELLGTGVKLDYMNGSPAVKEYPGTVRLIGRGYDTEDGDETLQLAVKIGVQASRYMNIDASDVAGRDTLRKSVGAAAILDEKDNLFVRKVLKAAIRDDSTRRDATPIVRQLGWNAGCSSFTLGRHAVHKNGTVTNVIPSEMLCGLLPATQVRGSPKHWVGMADYWNREEHYGMAFSLLSAFGAPLLSLLNMGVAGALIHLFSPDSGLGKSAVQAMCAAAYGDPKLLFFTPQDTINATLSRLGVYHTLPVCMDEVTNHPAEMVSTLVYQITQGREKLRLKSDASGVRQGSGNWCTTVITSGNASLMDKLFSIKSAPEGELMRFIEIRPTVKLEGIVTLSDVMEGLDENYGTVGALYAYFLVTQRPRVMQILADVRTRLRSKYGLGEAQRFWLALLTSNIAGGIIAKELGFVKYNMDEIEQWAMSYIVGHQSTITTRKLLPENVFHDIIARLTQSTVIAGSNGVPQPPKNAPLIRLDLKTRKLSVNMSALSQESQKLQMAMSDMTKGIVCETYKFSHIGVVNLTDGLPPSLFPPTPVRCAVYDVDPTLLELEILNTADNVVRIAERQK